jgi:hypothetical protein
MMRETSPYDKEETVIPSKISETEGLDPIRSEPVEAYSEKTTFTPPKISEDVSSTAVKSQVPGAPSGFTFGQQSSSSCSSFGFESHGFGSNNGYAINGQCSNPRPHIYIYGALGGYKLRGYSAYTPLSFIHSHLLVVLYSSCLFFSNS